MQNFIQILLSSAVLLAFFAVQLLSVVVAPFGIPGPLIQGCAALGLWAATKGARMGGAWVAVFLVIGIGAEVVEQLVAHWSSNSFGGSKRAAWGALIGGFAGAFFGGAIPVPIAGSLVASFIGTFAGAIIGELSADREKQPNLNVGIGAVVGRAVGIAVKLSIAFGILIASVVIVALS